MSSPAFNLQWCPGCQANVEPERRIPVGSKCPHCGHPFTSSGRTDIELFDSGAGSGAPTTTRQGSGGDLLTATQVTTVTSGTLTLNPKVDAEAVTPLCPDCEEPIERVEPESEPFSVVEFRCGCDDLRHFHFPERE